MSGWKKEGASPAYLALVVFNCTAEIAVATESTMEIGKISCKDCKQELSWSFLEKHTLMNMGAVRSFDIPVTYILMANGKQHCVARCGRMRQAERSKQTCCLAAKHHGHASQYAVQLNNISQE
jgi:hypothetical protein